jgi:hypothetical protein
MRAAIARASIVVLALPFVGWAEDDPGKTPAKAPAVIEAKFMDGSTLKLSLRDDAIEIVTPYGRLRVPTAEIRRLDFATRIPPDIAEQIDAWIADLGNPQFKVRETATAELAKLQDRAFHALVRAARHKDAEIAKRADDLVDRIRQEVPEERLEFRPHDVVVTAHSKFAGRIEGMSLKAITTQFGEVSLRLTDLRSLRSGPEAEPAAVNVLNDPGMLDGYQDRVGKTFAFRVTGELRGSVWGSDTYTLDSKLAVAAVHAGLVKQGQTAVVRIKILPASPAFQGTTRNGVTSSAYGFYPGAYEFVRKAVED